jgi:hypothetical protein
MLSNSVFLLKFRNNNLKAIGTAHIWLLPLKLIKIDTHNQEDFLFPHNMSNEYVGEHSFWKFLVRAQDSIPAF